MQRTNRPARVNTADPEDARQIPYSDALFTSQAHSRKPKKSEWSGTGKVLERGGARVPLEPHRAPALGQVQHSISWASRYMTTPNHGVLRTRPKSLRVPLPRPPGCVTCLVLVQSCSREPVRHARREHAPRHHAGLCRRHDPRLPLLDLPSGVRCARTYEYSYVSRPPTWAAVRSRALYQLSQRLFGQHEGDSQTLCRASCLVS